MAVKNADGLGGGGLSGKGKDQNKKQQSVSRDRFHQMAIKKV
jgi:hypothetical protein